jgi:uncharacterized protein (DUF305 family)
LPTDGFIHDYAPAQRTPISCAVAVPEYQVMEKRHYRALALMAAIHFAAMYILMYAMVNSLEQVIPNNNNLYMAALMTSPMLLIEIALMRSMYPNPRYNTIVIVVGLVLLVGAFSMIRMQTAIGDTQFLKSMIPHHSGAILMCRESAVTDPRVRDLCRSIIESQQREIEEMKTLLESM